LNKSLFGTSTDCNSVDWVRFFRFLVVGCINTLFGYGVYGGLILIGMHYTFASLFGIVLGVLFNFVTTGRLVFRFIDFSRIHRFVGVYALSYLLNVGLLTLLIFFGLSDLSAGAVLILPMALFNYQMLKTFVYSL